MDIAQALERHQLTRAGGQHDNRCKFLARVLAPNGPKPHLFTLRAKFSAGQRDAVAPDGIGHILKGQVVLPEPGFRELYGDFIGPDAENGHLRDLVKQAQLVLDFLSPLFQPLFRHIGRQRQQHDRLFNGDFLDHRLLRVCRKAGNGADAAAHAVQHVTHLVALAHQDVGRSRALARGGGIFLDSLYVLERLFNFSADAFFHLLGVRSRVNHADPDPVFGKFWKGFPHHLLRGNHAGHDQRNQHDGRENPVVDYG